MQKGHFLGLSAFQLLAMFRRGIFYSFLSIYLREYLKVSNTEMTLLATFSMLANITGQSLVWGRISDYFKKRRLLIMGGELFAAVGYLVVYAIHKNVGQNISLRGAAYTIIIGFTIIEFFWSSSNIGWTALIADLTTETERSSVMGRLQFVGGIGNILGVSISGLLYLGGKGFWDGNLFFISSGIMLVSIIGLMLIPESYAELEGYKDSLRNNDHNKEVSNNKNSIYNVNTPSKLDLGVFIWFLIVLGIVNIGANSINSILQVHIRLPETFNASDETLAWFRNTSSIAVILGGLVVGKLVSRFSDDKILIASMSTAFLVTLALPFLPSLPFFFLYAFIFGIVRVLTQTTSYSIVAKIIPLKRRGKLMAYYNATFYLAWGLGGTLITGPVADVIIRNGYPDFFAYEITFFVAALVVLIGILYYFIFKPRRYSLLTDGKLIE
ncbi:MAG: MFS transporter [Candidatus Heimdallarchaeaceae archaeon]